MSSSLEQSPEANLRAKSVAPTLAVVVPCYNEEEVLPETARRLDSLLASYVEAGLISRGSRVWFVDDGSRDRTWQLIRELSENSHSLFRGIKLSRNRGHQVALLAGLLTAEGDVLISVDADLQDDLNIIKKMLDRYVGGDDIVYGVRAARSTDTRFKRFTAEGYYRLLARLGVEIVYNHADYRLMSRRALEALRQFSESNVFLRGLIPQLGYPSSIVEYDRQERFAGESKYPLRKMLALAWQGVTSFSAAPLRAITALGLLVSLFSLSMGFWALGVRLFTEQAVPGWASIVIPLFLISGVQLLSLGIIGEYLAKVFMETKRRPLYFIEQQAGSSPIIDLDNRASLGQAPLSAEVGGRPA
jgi:polyisoprenyl-phosphate glycosyltransferase